MVAGEGKEVSLLLPWLGKHQGLSPSAVEDENLKRLILRIAS
jgi:hypothetical protein